MVVRLNRLAPWGKARETHDHLVFDSPRNPLQSNFELGSHEALLLKCVFLKADNAGTFDRTSVGKPRRPNHPLRSEEHTSELQSRFDLVCRLLLEKKKYI